MFELLQLLEQDARYTYEELAVMLEKTPDDVKRKIEEYEKAGVLKGYKALVDWERTERNFVSAQIELKVTPQKGRGFEEVAEMIAEYEEVESLYLMSGGYDLAVTVVGRDFKEIAFFVAYRLAVLDAVQSTATHFILRHYKEKGIVLLDKSSDERRLML